MFGFLVIAGIFKVVWRKELIDRECDVLEQVAGVASAAATALLVGHAVVDSFDRRSKDNKENEQNGSGPLSLDDLFERYEELQAEGLGDKTEEGQELRAMIRGYIDQERLPIRITRSTSNRELLDMIEHEIEGPKPEEETEAESDDEEQAEERPRRRR